MDQTDAGRSSPPCDTPSLRPRTGCRIPAPRRQRIRKQHNRIAPATQANDARLTPNLPARGHGLPRHGSSQQPASAKPSKRDHADPAQCDSPGHRNDGPAHLVLVVRARAGPTGTHGTIGSSPIGAATRPFSGIRITTSIQSTGVSLETPHIVLGVANLTRRDHLEHMVTTFPTTEQVARSRFRRTPGYAAIIGAT